MSRSWSIASKRAVSEMLSYVLMLMLVMGLGVAVYAYLQLQAPKERPVCGSDVLVVVDPAATSCVILDKEAQLVVALENRGRQGVSGAYLRIGRPGESIRTLINENRVFFGFVPDAQSTLLLPGTTYRYTLALPKTLVSTGENILEVQPLMGEPGKVALCERSTITQRITCAPSSS